MTKIFSSWARLVAFLFALSPFSTLCAQDAALLDIERIHFDDHQQALVLLNNLDLQSLSSEDKEYHRFLKALLSAYEGNLENAFHSLTAVYTDVQSTRVKNRTLVSLTAMASFLGKWEQGFMYANALQRALANEKDETLMLKGLQGLLIFYLNAEQYDIAKMLAQRIEKHSPADSPYRCLGEVAMMDIAAKEQVSESKEARYQTAKANCVASGSRYYISLLDNAYLTLLIKQNKPQQAYRLSKIMKKRVEDIDVLFLDLAFNASLAQLYYLLGDVEKAKTSATFVLDQLDKREFLQSRIDALLVMVKIAKAQQDFAQALQYAEALSKAESLLREDNVVKQVAYQQANFNLAIKENEIALLDKKNKLLEQQTQLTNEKINVVTLALVVIAICLAVLVFWSYRSRKLHLKFKQLAEKDGLTGAFNRSFFIESAQKVLPVQKDLQSDCCLILFDLDHFKQINDTQGHQVGDKLLSATVAAIYEVVNADTLVARMGGEEFAILMPRCDVIHGACVAEQCRKAIEGVRVTNVKSNLTVSASFGVSDTSQVGYNIDNLLAAADLALYKSKQNGRNQVNRYCVE